MRQGRYWEEEEKRRCRLCGWKEKTWEHVVEVCMGEERGGRRENILNILEEDGRMEGERWMRRLQKRRKEVERKERTGEGESRVSVRRKMEEGVARWVCTRGAARALERVTARGGGGEWR